MERGGRGLALQVSGDEVLLPVVTSFVERSALCFGLGKDEALGLTLAGEEIFAFLCRRVIPGEGNLEIRCSEGGYCVRADFCFRAEELDVRAFNLTTALSLDDDSDLDDMGLVMASRLVDRFRLTRETGHRVCLSLIKDKSYPLDENERPAVYPLLKEFSIRPPSSEEVKLIARQAGGCYDGQYLSDFFQYPGKLVDMVESREYRAVAAIGPAGEIGGAILWHWMGGRTVECLGPYVFSNDPDGSIPGSLVEGCIGAIARTHAVGLINTLPTPQLPEHYFEKLGTVAITAADGSTISLQARFRLIHEDAGCAVWVHAGVRDFVEREYQRLVLPREIRAAGNVGESLRGHSVIFAEFDRLQHRVILRPMWPGADCEENIEKHVRLIRREGIPNISFCMDLGQAWQADFAPGLLRQGFKPCCLLPYGGEADVIIFQLLEGAA